MDFYKFYAFISRVLGLHTQKYYFFQNDEQKGRDHFSVHMLTSDHCNTSNFRYLKNNPKVATDSFSE